ncbi:MAG TPA: WD40 repeat domain-containing protein [Actinoplanes sp.]|nr:WD40 repeat domain-containing protein [Actinoplanes sp.]
MGARQRPERLLTLAAVVLVVATATGMQTARRAEHTAATTARADAQRLGELALAEPEIDHALLLAVRGVRLDNTPATRSTLLALLSRSPQLTGVTHVPPGSLGPVRAEVLSHDGGLRASITGDRAVSVWEVASGERIEQLHGHAAPVRQMAFSPDDTVLRTTDSAGTVLIWDLSGDHRLARRYTAAGRAHGSRATTVPRPGGGAVASVGTSPGVTWLRMVDLAGGAGVPFGVRTNGRISPVWRPDGGRLATVDSDGFLRTWNPATGAQLAGNHSMAWARAAITYSPDGRTVLVASWDGRLHRLDAENLSREGPPIDVGYRLGAVAAAPGGRMAAVLGAEADSDDVRLTRYAIVDLAHGTVYRRGTIDFDATAVAVAPDGRRLAIAGQMGELLLLDVRTAQPIRRAVTGHISSVLTVAYSPDGSRMVTGGYDGRVGLWSARTGEMLGSLLPGARGTAVRPIFLPDGHTVLIASEDGTVARWDARPAHWLTFACAVAGRVLTRAEWADALGDRPYRSGC